MNGDSCHLSDPKFVHSFGGGEVGGVVLMFSVSFVSLVSLVNFC